MTESTGLILKSEDVFPLGSEEDDTKEKTLRIKMAEVIHPFAKGNQHELMLLERIDKALRNCALAGGGNAELTRKAYEVGVESFLENPK